MKRLIFGFVLGVLLNGCHGKSARVGVPVNRDGFVYVQAELDLFYVIVDAKSKIKLTDILRDIGCGVCVTIYDASHEIVIVRRFRK